MGRGGRPVHQHGEDHHRPAPGQARRPAGDPDRPGKRLPHRRTVMHTHRPRPGPPRWLRPPRPTARLRLTILYGAAFLACGVVVLAVIAYLLDGHTTTHVPTSSRPATAEIHGKFPVADVQQAGGYDIIRVPVKVPAADVQQVGGYDVLNAYVPAATAQKLVGPAAALTAAEQAKLLAEAQVQVNFDKREILIISATALAFIAVAAAAIGWI